MATSLFSGQKEHFKSKHMLNDTLNLPRSVDAVLRLGIYEKEVVLAIYEHLEVQGKVTAGDILEVLQNDDLYSNFEKVKNNLFVADIETDGGHTSHRGKKQVETDNIRSSFQTHYSPPSGPNSEKNLDSNDKGYNTTDSPLVRSNESRKLVNHINLGYNVSGKSNNTKENSRSEGGDYKTSSDLENIVHENEAIKRSRACRKCNVRQADIILLPCRHVSVCHCCWDPKIKSTCPQCKTDVAGMFHVFWG